VATPIDLQLAGLVRECIAAANYGRWPKTLEEWHEIARRLGVTCVCVQFRVGGAFLLDDLLVYEMGTPEQLARRMAHELSESRLRCECESPYILEDHEGAFHRIAAVVEASPV
jgi:hypothetical protein